MARRSVSPLTRRPVARRVPTDGGGSGGHVQHQDTQVLLSSVPPPEFWCSITYFELDTQVRHPPPIRRWHCYV